MTRGSFSYETFPFESTILQEVSPFHPRNQMWLTDSILPPRCSIIRGRYRSPLVNGSIRGTLFNLILHQYGLLTLDEICLMINCNNIVCICTLWLTVDTTSRFGADNRYCRIRKLAIIVCGVLPFVSGIISIKLNFANKYNHIGLSRFVLDVAVLMHALILLSEKIKLSHLLLSISTAASTQRLALTIRSYFLHTTLSALVVFSIARSSCHVAWLLLPCA